MSEVSSSISKFGRVSTRVAIGAGAIFVLLLVVLHFVRNDLNPGMHFISEYEVGPSGWLMRLAFFALALSCIVATAAVFPDSRSVTGFIGMFLLVVSAAGMTMAGIVPPGPQPGLHDLGATLDLVPLAALFLSFRAGRLEIWKGHRLLLWSIGVFPLIGFVLYAGAMATVMRGIVWDPAIGAPVGWQNRLMILIQAGWIVAFVWLNHYYRSKRQER